MDNQEALESQASELWSLSQTIKEIAGLKKEAAKSLMDSKESARLIIEAAKHLEEYLVLRKKAGDLYKQAGGDFFTAKRRNKGNIKTSEIKGGVLWECSKSLICRPKSRAKG